MKFKKTIKLIVPGNRNIPALINSIIRATLQLRENENHQDLVFNQIHIFHTEESVKELMTTSLNWQEELSNYEISNTNLVHHITKIEDSSEDRFADLVEQLRDIVKPLEKQDYYIDLSGGVSSLKSILAVFAYVLDIEHIYTFEVKFSDEREKSNKQRKLFYTELVKEDISIKYRKFPAISKFDEFGKLNLTKITRYRKLFNSLEDDLRLIGVVDSNAEHIKDSLLTGVNSQLSGEVYKDKNDFRNTVFSYSSAVEEMSNILLETFKKDNKHYDMTLGQKLGEVRNVAEKNPNYFINLQVLEDLTKLIKSIRNDIIHPSPNKKINSDILEAQSNVSHEIAIAFIRFASNAVNSFKDTSGELLSISEIKTADENIEYYFGFDGDNTGDFLDDSFKTNDEQILIDKSRKIKKAVSKIQSEIKKQANGKNPILFAEGDNVLFKMKFDESILRKIQHLYKSETGMNSSIGYGESLQESAIALKLSKSNDGNTILGIKKKNES